MTFRRLSSSYFKEGNIPLENLCCVSENAFEVNTSGAKEYESKKLFSIAITINLSLGLIN
jgi:hypothetical protein